MNKCFPPWLRPQVHFMRPKAWCCRNLYCRYCLYLASIDKHLYFFFFKQLPAQDVSCTWLKDTHALQRLSVSVLWNNIKALHSALWDIHSLITVYSNDSLIMHASVRSAETRWWLIGLRGGKSEHAFIERSEQCSQSRSERLMLKFSGFGLLNAWWKTTNAHDPDTPSVSVGASCCSGNRFFFNMLWMSVTSECAAEASRSSFHHKRAVSKQWLEATTQCY